MLAGYLAHLRGERLAALQHATHVERGELVGALLQRHLHIAQRGIGIAHDRVDLCAQVQARTYLAARLTELGDIEKGTEEIATVVSWPFRAHVPNSIRSHLAVRLHAGDDVEREVGEAKFLELVVSPDPHPALDGDVVANQSDVVELSGV